MVHHDTVMCYHGIAIDHHGNAVATPLVIAHHDGSWHRHGIAIAKRDVNLPWQRYGDAMVLTTAYIMRRHD